MWKQLDLVGKKINHLTVLSKETTIGRTRFKCHCDCGNVTIVDGPKLNSGVIKGCGCQTGKQPKPTLRKGLGESTRNALFWQYRDNARKKSIPFELTNGQMEKMFKSVCFYCGREPYRTLKKPNCYGHYVCNGIDRKDNSKGYTKSNCVSCCLECNFMKNTYHIDEFLKLIRMIYENRVKTLYELR